MVLTQRGRTGLVSGGQQKQGENARRGRVYKLDFGPHTAYNAFQVQGLEFESSGVLEFVVLARLCGLFVANMFDSLVFLAVTLSIFCLIKVAEPASYYGYHPTDKVSFLFVS